MSLDSVLSEITREVPECVAAGYVDLTTGMLLGIKTIDSHPQEVIDLLAAATGDMFQGTNVMTIENLFKRMRGTPEDPDHYFREIIITSTNLIHIFTRSKKNQDNVLVTACRASTNIGMALSKTRQALSRVEAVA